MWSYPQRAWGVNTCSASTQWCWKVYLFEGGKASENMVLFTQAQDIIGKTAAVFFRAS
jgi:hypothetical protein